MDVDTIVLGRDFRQVLRERFKSCDLMLALVGRNWVDAKNSSGQRRLEDPDDYVWLEIDASLKRNIPVTPVLVQGAQMPTVEQLPEEIRDFAYRNGFELSHNRWNSDVQEMIKRLGLSKQGDHRKPWPTIVGVSVVAMALVDGGVFYYRTVVEEKTAVQTEREVAIALGAYIEAQGLSVDENRLRLRRIQEILEDLGVPEPNAIASFLMKSGQHLKLPKSEQQAFEENLRLQVKMEGLKVDIKVKDNGDNTVDISWTVTDRRRPEIEELQQKVSRRLGLIP